MAAVVPSSLKFLLLQARNPGDEAVAQEHLAFCEALGCDAGSVIAWDLLGGPPPFDIVDSCDCVLVGGSGEYGMGDAADHPWLSGFIDFCGEMATRGTAMFASCFGFQALIVAAGGKIVTDKSRAEVGSFEVTLTAAGREDPLLGPIGPRFFAQFGHKDHALEMPSGMVHLAGSQRSPFQALMIPGKPIYATQFHPELSMKQNKWRFDRYIAAYSRPDFVDAPQKVLATFRETTEASSLIPRFVEQILLPKDAARS